MRVNTKVVMQMNPDGSFTELERESFSYDGPVSQCFGGDSKTSSSTTQITETNQAANEIGEGVGISSLGDANVSFETTDLGAVQGAFSFTQDFSDSVLDFANDAQAQAADISERALETTRGALSTVATGGGSDLAGINQRTILIGAAIIAAVVVLPNLIRSK